MRRESCLADAQGVAHGSQLIYRMNGVLQDLQFAIRTLRRHAGLSLVVILTLSLGIGANAAIFSIVNAYLVRPLPFASPGELVHVWRTKAGVDFGNVLRMAEGDFLDLRASAGAFSDLGAYDYGTRTLTNVEEPYGINVTRVTWNLPRVLGVRPSIGRWFREGDAGTKVALVSHSFWKQQLGGDTTIAGRTVELDGDDYEVLGVMPPAFVFPFRATRVWVPLSLFGSESSRGTGDLLVIGRLAPGMTLLQAQSQADVVAKRLAKQHPRENINLGSRVVPVREALVFFIDELRGASVALLVATGFVLVIICSNVANLLLARAASRRREMALRAAIGASRWRLIRQLLVEGAVLAIMGAALGTLIAAAAGGAIGTVLPEDMYRVGELTVDQSVFIFVAGVSALSVLLFALAPAVEASRVNVLDSLKEGTPVGGSRRTGRVRATLIVSQVALATVLLFGTLISLQAFQGLRQFNPGFAVDDVLTVEINLNWARYWNEEQQNAYYADALSRVRPLPGVAAAATVHPLPMNWELHFREFTVEGREPASGAKLTAARFLVSPGYFEAMKIPVVEGRDFTSRDTAASPRVVVVSRRFEELYFPNESAVGRRLRLHPDNAADYMAEIVGVVANSRDFMMHEDYRAQIFLADLQHAGNRRFIVVRGEGNPTLLMSALKTEIRAIDRTVALPEIRRMTDVVFQSVAPMAGVATVLGALGLGALLLVGLGVYGVVAFSMRQRTHEIGVRMALGASGGEVVRLALHQGIVLVGIGLAIGVLLVIGPAVAAERLLAVGRIAQPAPLLLSALALTVTGVLASYLPARHAARVEPAAALRQE